MGPAAKVSDLSVPADLEAEEAVVGCAIASDVGYRLVAGRLPASAFWRPRHGDLFRACGDPEVRAIDGLSLEALNERYRPPACLGCVAFTANAAAERYVRETTCERCGPTAGFPRPAVARMLRVAQLAAVDLDEVRRLVEERPVWADLAGTYAARVVEAWRAREAMRVLAEAYNGLAAGQPLDSVLPPALVALGAT